LSNAGHFEISNTENHNKATIQTPKGSVCRFFKPEETHVGETTIETDSSIRLHRPVGCEYVNAYNPTVMSVLKCNHDVQFVTCNETKNTAAYVCKYCIKQQNPVENYAALSVAAFAKALDKSDALPPDATEIQRGKRILGSMLYSVTNGQEVAATMAALYVLRESPFWFSHDPVRVDLGIMLRPHGDFEEINVPRNADAHRNAANNYAKPRNLLEKYWAREGTLESLPFIDYCERYDISSRATDSDVMTMTDSVPGNQKTNTRISRRKVLVICGRDIPYISNDADSDTQNFYYSAVLSLFKPHRKETLLSTSQTPISTYREFVETSDRTLVDRVVKFEDRLRDYYKADRSDSTSMMETVEAHLLKTRAPPSTLWSSEELKKPGELQDDEMDTTVPDLVDEMTTSMEIDMASEKLAESSRAIVDKVPNLRDALDATAAAYPEVDGFTVDAGFDFDKYADLIASTMPFADVKKTGGTDDFMRAFHDALTRLERFEECFRPVPWSQPNDCPRWTKATLPGFPSIAATAEAYSLNFWQHSMFEAAARHLLYAYSTDVEAALDEQMYPTSHSAEPYDIKSQLIAFFGGEAGTGKSTVIHALLNFAKLWGRDGSVETLAFTGVAAINIDGRTIHSARNLLLNGAQHKTDPSVEMKARFSRVILVIIDEISMTDQALLGGADIASGTLAGTRGKIMGGRHTIFSGDWGQLPSIAGSPCEESISYTLYYGDKS
jgi:hypothetical protein